MDLGESELLALLSRLTSPMRCLLAGSLQQAAHTYHLDWRQTMPSPEILREHCQHKYDHIIDCTTVRHTQSLEQLQKRRT
eukprot:6213658-Amphidinium_carterae.2